MVEEIPRQEIMKMIWEVIRIVRTLNTRKEHKIEVVFVKYFLVLLGALPAKTRQRYA